LLSRFTGDVIDVQITAVGLVELLTASIVPSSRLFVTVKRLDKAGSTKLARQSWLVELNDDLHQSSDWIMPFLINQAVQIGSLSQADGR
jgi:hypothetical protein